MARPFSAMIERAVAGAEAMQGFQSLLRRCPTLSDQKMLVLAAYEHGALDADQTTLLIAAHMLEAE